MEALRNNDGTPLRQRKRLRIAILSTGINRHNIFILAHRKAFKPGRSWIGGDAHNIHDSHGDGTLMATALLRACPHVEIYMAKIADEQNFDPRDTVAEVQEHTL